MLLPNVPLRKDAHSPSRILVVSRDPMLLQTRRLVLGTYFEVESVGRVSEAVSILSRSSFNLVVLCDTLGAWERREIEDVVHAQQPSPSILSPSGPGEKTPAGAGRKGFACHHGSLQLLKQCAEILAREQSRTRCLPESDFSV